MKVKEQVELFIAEQGILPLNPSKDAKKAATHKKFIWPTPTGPPLVPASAHTNNKKLTKQIFNHSFSNIV